MASLLALAAVVVTGPVAAAPPNIMLVVADGDFTPGSMHHAPCTPNATLPMTHILLKSYTSRRTLVPNPMPPRLDLWHGNPNPVATPSTPVPTE